MSITLDNARPYQAAAVMECMTKWMTEGRRGVLVSPTGSGKTFMAELAMVGLRDKKQIFFAHTQEIILQTAARLRKRFPSVGIVMADEPLTLDAPIQVATVQTCLARSFFPEADVIYLDECHHYASDDWQQLQEHYQNALVLGLTATPQRGDGRALDAHFDWLVVAAKYSELVEAGHIVPCRAYQPPEVMVKGLAHDPVKAWERYAKGQRTFLFANTVKNAEKFCKAFRDAGVPAAVVEANTNKRERRHIISLFGKGDITVLCNVDALTEGVDVPAASCVILGRQYQKVGKYLQACGRPLRPYPGKEYATIIDLSGATLIHGLPTEDREYSLGGDGIERTSEAPLRNCLSCGATVLSAYPACPECGYEFPKATRQEIRIYSYELRAVFAGQATADEHKRNEWKRLLAFSKDRTWSVSWAIKEYRSLFNEAPDMALVDEGRRYAEWLALQKVAHAKGFKRGFTFARYKSMFGENPPRQWKMLNAKDLAVA